MKRYFALWLIILCTFFSLGAFSFDSQSTAFSVNTETKDVNTITDVRQINELLDGLEKNWNNHSIEKIVQYYSQDFVNGDGLGIEAIKNLTLELWTAYPDISTKSQERTVRINGEYASVESTDLYQGASSMIRDEVGTKGILKAVSVGEVFLKKFGSVWKITSDKTIFEKVSIGYGIGSELIDNNKIMFYTPEQIASEQQYTAKLTFNLPSDIKPVAAISKEVLVYPQVSPEDKFRLINESELERLLVSNKVSRNELVTATIGLTGGALKPKLLGLVFLTRRVNVVPVSEVKDEVSIINLPAKSALTKTIDLLDFYEYDKSHDSKENKSEPDSDSKE